MDILGIATTDSEFMVDHWIYLLNMQKHQLQHIFTMNLHVEIRTSPSVEANPVYNTGSGWQSNLAGVDNRAWSSAPTQLSPQLNQAVFYASTTAWGSQYVGMVVQAYTPTGAAANFLEISAEL
jgi:hypothetical protein